MPDFPIHALEGNLAPVMPTVLPVQLLPAARKIHPDDLGIIENKPPSQLSLMDDGHSTTAAKTNAKHPHRNEIFRSGNWTS